MLKRKKEHRNTATCTNNRCNNSLKT